MLPIHALMDVVDAGTMRIKRANDHYQAPIYTRSVRIVYSAVLLIRGTG